MPLRQTVRIRSVGAKNLSPETSPAIAPTYNPRRHSSDSRNLNAQVLSFFIHVPGLRESDGTYPIGRGEKPFARNLPAYSSDIQPPPSCPIFCALALLIRNALQQCEKKNEGRRVCLLSPQSRAALPRAKDFSPLPAFGFNPARHSPGRKSFRPKPPRL